MTEPAESTLRVPSEGLVLGDCLDVMRQMPSDEVDLIYIDPPFGTGRTQRLETIRLGRGDRVRTGFGGRTFSFEVERRLTYRDDMPLDEYLEFLFVRLSEMYRVLKTSGSLYLHLDYRAVHYARLMLNEIFGEDRFLNEIIWAYDYGGRARDRWPRKHDNILWYAKSGSWTFNREAIDRLPYMAPSLVGPEKAARGKLPTDVWWMTIVPTNSRQRTGYPTQKPLPLLRRIVRASSNAGDLVADFFAGSGTTGVAAAEEGRRYLLVDTNPEAVDIAHERLARVIQMPQLFPD